MATKRKAAGSKRRASSVTGAVARRPRRPASSPAGGATVSLRTDKGTLATFAAAVLERDAMAWAARVRNRIRWNGRAQSLLEQSARCRELLKKLGVGDAELRHATERGIIEVSMPAAQVEEAWPACILPWEYVLSAATYDLRKDAATGRPGGSFPKLTVVRHVDRGAVPKRRPAKSVLVASITPGEVDEIYDLSEEEQLPGERLKVKHANRSLLRNPTLQTLIRNTRSKSPDVIHVAGADSHQTAELLKFPQGSEVKDGVFLPSEGDSADLDWVSSSQLAAALTAGSTKPALVVFNLHHSSARTAAWTVERGADAAVGFQDTFDDLAAELFISDFYRAWEASKGDAGVAFQAGWAALRGFPNLTGSGVVLWSARSLVQNAEKARSAAADEHARIEERRAKVVQPKENDITVRCRPLSRLNYALLHNQRPLFEVFEIRKAASLEGVVRGVRVEVDVSTGDTPVTYRATKELTDAGLNMAEEVFVPLTSNLYRTIQESLVTSLSVKVRAGDSTIVDEQHPVTLLPINEWVDDDLNRQYLPSFVWPLDPAVRRIITRAQSYLGALTDDPTCGFDGYQCIDPELEDPSEGVDLQVAALWRSLLDDRLGYVNPPPSYTQLSQRIRTPSQILEGGRGTCIDFALLIASCLEYVEIYPTIFLIEGHAFPGYWRSEEAWETFVNDPEGTGPNVSHDQTPSSLGDCTWMFPKSPHRNVRKSIHRRIREQIEKGHLVALESVWLSSNRGFEEAMDDGWDNLAHPAEFNSMIDIRSAREATPRAVTPLPLGVAHG